MKRIIILTLSCVVLVSSCKKYLEEKTNGILTPDNYYNTSEQIRAAVNGAYTGLNSPFATGIGVAVSSVFSLEYITGYCLRPRPSGYEDNQYLQLTGLDQANGSLATWWTSCYYPIENCNSIIANITRSNTVNGDVKNNFLAEAYFLRAYYYFNAVRLYGRVPLKTTPTTDLNNTQIGRSSIDAVYQQIVSDLTIAEKANLAWTDKTGHVSKGAIKSLLAKVYLTMAGAPLNKGTTHYQLAYDKAKEVIQSGQFSLFASYQDLRNPALNNSGEHILMIQHDETTIPNIMHFSLMPYPDQPVSIQSAYGGAMAPAAEFYNSYATNDLRKQEKAFYYTQHEQYANASSIIKLPAPYIYKYWNDAAEVSGRDGSNFPLIRYADVLLIAAEAKAMADGGSTTDAVALTAYTAVHKRAFPAYAQPTGIAADEVLKERFWELAYEFQTWFDMQRTRKAFDVVNNRMVSLIGYKAPVHNRAFIETDLLWPIPLTEVQKDPSLAN
ncbi:MAG: RagB/SusD family nutrient uptake outer membrane protein [Sphingobacteriaceae bacterium]|nr:MAG: RagB/SusD family nutrient uptake outer membrane protein [Sphingobacteriaceae bacterium]